MLKIICGDSLKKLKSLEDNSIDSIVTDPPYGLSFMNKKWDYDVPSKEIWAEALRVLKPGGHLLAFGGTRTYHRLVVNIEDAGFEIRDQIQWLYGSGFPKSHNIGKAIDKLNGTEREVIGEADVGPDFTGDNFHRDSGERKISKITKGNSEWEGWGTALKPANEPICVARKPLEKGLTVAQNVLKWGTGAINIDECRVTLDSNVNLNAKQKNFDAMGYGGNENTDGVSTYNSQGRWPANIILDEVAAEMLDEQSGQFKGSIGRANRKSAGNYEASNYKVGVVTETEISDFGGASRFFYCAKASKSERNRGLEGMPEVESSSGDKRPSGNMNERLHGKENRGPVIAKNNHPTVKPIKLMEYLIRLVTPKGGTTLDPFMGSGSTGVAAKNLKRNFIGIEIDKNYFNISKVRIKRA